MFDDEEAATFNRTIRKNLQLSYKTQGVTIQIIKLLLATTPGNPSRTVLYCFLPLLSLCMQKQFVAVPIHGDKKKYLRWNHKIFPFSVLLEYFVS